MDKLSFIQVGVLVFLGYAGLELTRHIVRYFFGKLTRDTDSVYVLKTECQRLRQACEQIRGGISCRVDDAFSIMCDELTIVKELMLIIGRKLDVSDAELKKLTRTHISSRLFEDIKDER